MAKTSAELAQELFDDEGIGSGDAKVRALASQLAPPPESSADVSRMLTRGLGPQFELGEQLNRVLGGMVETPVEGAKDLYKQPLGQSITQLLHGARETGQNLLSKATQDPNDALNRLLVSAIGKQFGLGSPEGPIKSAIPQYTAPDHDKPLTRIGAGASILPLALAGGAVGAELAEAGAGPLAERLGVMGEKLGTAGKNLRGSQSDLARIAGGITRGAGAGTRALASRVPGAARFGGEVAGGTTLAEAPDTEQHNLGEDMGLNAAIELLFKGGGMGLKGGKKAIEMGVDAIPSTIKTDKYLTGLKAKRTPEEIEAARNAILPEIEQMPFGYVIDSDAAKDHAREVALMAYSGMEKPGQQIKNAVQDKIRKMDLPIGNTRQNMPSVTFNKQMEGYMPFVENTGKKYEKLAEEQSKNFVDYKPDRLFNHLDSVKEELKEATSDSAGKKYLGPVKTFVDDMYRELSPQAIGIKGYEGSEVPGTKLVRGSDVLYKRPLIQKAEIHYRNLNRLFQDMREKGNAPAIHYLKGIKDAFEDSIDHSSEDHPGLYKLHKEAQAARREQGKWEHYGDPSGKKTPFYKAFLEGGPKGNYLDDYFKFSDKGKDYSGLSKELMDTLGWDQGLGREILASKLSGDTLSQQVKNLGRLNDAQISHFAGPESAKHIKELKEFNKYYPSIVSNPESLLPMTGARGERASQKYSTIQKLLTTAGGSGGAAGLWMHSPLTTAISAALGIGGPIAYGRMATKMHTSPAMVDRYLEAVERQGRHVESKAPKKKGAPNIGDLISAYTKSTTAQTPQRGEP